jgi:nucleotide-binding universal stress UspA family protein
MHTDLNPTTILVLANETADADALRDVIERSAGDDANVLVVAPALNSRLRRRASDEDGARDRAKERLQRGVAQLHAAGVDATGLIGDADPLQAMRDALAWFPADLLIVATHAAGRSNWLATNLVERASAHFAGPILHVTVADAAPAMALAA